MTKSDSPSRLQSKEHTRQGLIRAALKLLSHSSFDSLSLRQVTRQAGITPTAFYRHFDDMEELGLVLVEESFLSLGAMLKDARAQSPFDGDTIERSLAVVLLHLHNHTAHFRFIARERYGGVRRLRRAINDHRAGNRWQRRKKIDGQRAVARKIEINGRGNAAGVHIQDGLPQ